MALTQLLAALDHSGHQRLQALVALGRWPDGRALSDAEREACIQALIAYEAGLPETERSGYIAERCHNAHEDDVQVVSVPE